MLEYGFHLPSKGIMQMILAKGTNTFMKFFLLLSLLFITVFAQSIQSIQFKGLVHLSSDMATGILGLEADSELDEDKLNTGLKKLFEQGYFQEISVDTLDGNITINCKEKPIISKITVHGFKESDETKQEEVMDLKKGKIFDEKKLEKAKRRILSYLETEGAIDSVVEVEVVHQKNGSVELEFFVNPGKEITITSLLLDGANDIDQEKLTDIMANNEAQSFGWWFGRHDGALKLPELKVDPLRMADVYRQNGYLDIDIKSPLLRVDFNSFDAQLSYQISEGVQYKVASTSFSGNGDIVSDKIIKKQIRLKAGKVFDIGIVRKDMERIKGKISSLGYAFVKVNPLLPRDKDKKTVDVKYQIIPGEKVYIRDVIIVGNDRTLDRVIRRDVYLAPGDLYSGLDLKQSRNALKRTGNFEKATIEEKRITANSMDIIVHVKEAPTGNIQIGGGYGSYNGLSFDASVSDKNIFGSGISAGLKFQTAKFSQAQSLNFSNPRLNDSEYSGSMSFFMREFELQNTYRTESGGVSFSVGKRLSRTWSANVGYNYSSTSYPYLNPDANLTSEQIQAYDKSSMTLGLSFNNTDDFYVPRSGSTFSNYIEVAGIGAKAQFFKDSLSFATFKGLEEYIGFDIIVRLKAKARWIKDHGFVPIDQHFFMGGLGTVRGYDQFSLPAFNDANTARVFYAKKMMTNSLEFSFPMVDAAKLRFAVFADYGFIGEQEFSEEERGAYGGQIEWFSPLGPIALIFGRAFNNKDGDRLNNFEFSIGRPF